MRFLRVAIAGLIILCAGFLTPAMAQDAVSLRTGSHDDYSRLVIEWPGKPQYSVSKEGNRVLIRFAKSGTPDLKGVDASSTNIKKVETISTGTEPLQMAVTIPDGSRFRDFIVENKMILDVYNSKGETAKLEEKPAAPVAEVKPAVEQTVETPKADFSVKPAEVATTAPVEKVEGTKIDAPALGEHVITMTSTTGFGVASFVRAGWLWIVVDHAEQAVKPILSGPQKDQLGGFTQISVPGGTAYRMELPENLHARGEGGGLGWRIVLSAKPNAKKEAVIDRGEGSLAWKLSLMRKHIDFTDPVIGDQIDVVTALHSDQFAGTSKSFVDLDQLESVIGLAFVAKADGLKAEVLPDRVVINRDGGLSVSSVTAAAVVAPTPAPGPTPAVEETKEVAPVEEAASEDPAPERKTAEQVAAEHAAEAAVDHAALQGDPHAAKPLEELQEVADAKPSGNNIYNFPRWEMGGIQALNNNMNVIMLENAGKADADRIEGIITMAKLNLANNRAPEAMGLLRIAEQFVPQLDENTEFQALRGAASALAGKFDVAFDNFSEVDIQKFDDVKYWRAYTLAGLEDWKQAIDTLPENFDDLMTYPAVIRMPLALSFAEIALRGGKVPLAEKILGLIKPDIDKGPPQYKASWNYLTGEAERQKGNSPKAQEYWKPLVEGGKDYLFRAKAGLSLTKLQIDEKQLKPAEAIDRLEGLRYAWRGDELETLINYRLGQMYVENKDFLKGLTILRNAESLAKGHLLSEDIQKYMKKTFHDVFANNRLKDVSPLESISLYEEFKDMAPQGEEGTKVVEKLAERLVDADMLGRAASLLEYEVNNKLQGTKKAEIAIRLSAIRLLDGNPDGALRSLEIAQDVLNKVEPSASADKVEEKADPAKASGAEEAVKPEPTKPLTTDSEKQRQIDLLKARALSMKKKTDEAMAILEKMRLDPDVNKLRADIAWGAGRWEEAATALNDLILADDISSKKPLTPYQADLILNRGIALSLSGNRVALANLRERYNTQMTSTAKGKVFEIVSRPRRPDMVGSRQAIESMISELSLFQGFIDGYAGLSPDAKAKEPATTATPAATATPAQEKAPVAEPVPAEKVPENPPAQ